RSEGEPGSLTDLDGCRARVQEILVEPLTAIEEAFRVGLRKRVECGDAFSGDGVAADHVVKLVAQIAGDGSGIGNQLEAVRIVRIPVDVIGAVLIEIRSHLVKAVLLASPPKLVEAMRVESSELSGVFRSWSAIRFTPGCSVTLM